jgi:hypothetical protein
VRSSRDVVIINVVEDLAVVETEVAGEEEGADEVVEDEGHEMENIRIDDFTVKHSEASGPWTHRYKLCCSHEEAQLHWLAWYKGNSYMMHTSCVFNAGQRKMNILDVMGWEEKRSDHCPFILSVGYSARKNNAGL